MHFAPDQAGAHDAVVLYIIRLMTRLITSKWYYKEYEDLAMDWVEDQFAERAADTWRRVTAVTKRTATTSGIGPNSVLYRSLRDMLHAYPAHGVKNHIMATKSKELVWTPTKTVVEIHSAFMAYYEAYDRAVAITAGIVARRHRSPVSPFAHSHSPWPSAAVFCRVSPCGDHARSPPCLRPQSHDLL
jgi:hypothetical protein